MPPEGGKVFLKDELVPPEGRKAFELVPPERRKGFSYQFEPNETRIHSNSN